MYAVAISLVSGSKFLIADYLTGVPKRSAVLSVEDVGVYKPNRKVYQLAVDRLGIPASAISF